MSLDATHPFQNATVFASAGTGKTWLLVARLTRLLLAGAQPGSILAVTFTKKAAGEMQERLLERLQHFATCSEEELIAGFREIGEEPDSRIMQTARGLYEILLDAIQPVRTTTYHSFCHDLLSRFPLQADIPPGYELVEDTAELQETAWENFIQQASSNDHPVLKQATLELIDQSGSIGNMQTSLDAFLNSRADWWAYTETVDAPLQWALEQLPLHFDCSPDDDPYETISSDAWRQKIERYAELLGADKAPAGNKTKSAEMLAAINEGLNGKALISIVHSRVLKKDGDPYALKPSQAYRKANGEDAAEELLQLHSEIAERLLDVIDLQNRQQNLRLNQNWYIAGNAYLDHYQDIKLQRRQLDFSDMEWQAYRLLNSREDTEWVQFKLDERIDHLLIDEFQDTNPTQWRLLFPLLQEFANTDPQEHRSVFLVGDTKQSIYSFRRANPKLQGTASDWLQANLRSQHYSMDDSRRSAPAIMQAVNAVFQAEPFNQLITDFNDHGTFHDGLWGRVEIHPAFEIPKEPKLAPEDRPPLRDPLTTPRPEKPSAKKLEAEFIAQRIEELIAAKTVVGKGKDARHIEYGDIKILLRSRTSAPHIEDALRSQNIPFIGTSRGMLLPRLEIQDIRVLLRLLHSPQDNLALAQVLKSPIFSATDDDLITLAKTPGDTWTDRLATVAETLPENHALRWAQTLLSRWRKLCATLPLHDLLETIYFDGNILERYSDASRDWQRDQVLTNLQRMITLALEIDSGRYPSLTHFLMRLETLEHAKDGAPDEPKPDSHTNAVQIHTIHDSKGLEAPVIFYADLAAAEQKDKAWNSIVDWPAESDRPLHFILQVPKEKLDSRTQKLINRRQSIQDHEKGNLIYVALTRARQMLILSASKNSRSSKLHTDLLAALTPVMEEQDNGVLVLENGQCDKVVPKEITKPENPEIPQHLLKPLELAKKRQERSPSRMEGESDSHTAIPGLVTDEQGQDRGTVIHALLEHLSIHPDWSRTAILNRVGADHNLEPDSETLNQWMDEAENVLGTFPELFQPEGKSGHSELPLVYQQNGEQVYGIIDRLLVAGDHLQLIDYKTHRVDSLEQANAIAHQYIGQLQAYATGLNKVYPDKPVKAQLLFTAIPALVDVALPTP